MGAFSAQTLVQKKNRPLTEQAFRRLLAWLDQGQDSEGQTYLEMRHRLVSYFDRKNCSGPEDLADETLNRLARRLEEEGTIETETPARYCYILARFVFMEYLRSTQRHQAMLTNMHPPPSQATKVVASDDAEQRMLTCLEQCMGQLEPAKREIILSYYTGKEREKIDNRRALAQTLGISVNALTIRACRIREKLEDCVRECCRED